MYLLASVFLGFCGRVFNFFCDFVVSGKQEHPRESKYSKQSKGMKQERVAEGGGLEGGAMVGSMMLGAAFERLTDVLAMEFRFVRLFHEPEARFVRNWIE